MTRAQTYCPPLGEHVLRTCKTTWTGDDGQRHHRETKVTMTGTVITEWIDHDWRGPVVVGGAVR